MNKETLEIFDSIQTGVYRADSKGVFLYSNAYLNALLGVKTTAELNSITTNNGKILEYLTKTKFKEQLEGSSEIIGNIARFLRDDGTTIFVRENITIVRDDKNNPLFFDGTIEDITELYNSYSEQKRRAHHFSLMLFNDNTGDRVLFNSNGIVLEAVGNHIFVDNYTKLSEKTLSSVIKPSIYTYLLQTIDLYNVASKVSNTFVFAGSEYVSTLEPLHKEKSGAVISLLTVIKTDELPQLGSQNSIYTQQVEYFLQMLDQRNDELFAINQKLRESEEKLQLTNIGKDKLISIIAHDLKGPFTGFLHLTDYLKKTANSVTPEEITEIAGELNSSAKHIHSLLENLLQWSRLQRDLFKPQPATFNLATRVDVVLELLKPAALSKKISLINKIKKDTTFNTDPFMVDTVIRNLLSNSIKYCFREGKVTVSYKETKQGKFISVTDTGVGIGQEALEKLFSLNYSSSTPGTANEKGTGVGLLLSKDMVERCGGELLVKSTLGKGTTFTIAFYQKSNP